MKIKIKDNLHVFDFSKGKWGLEKTSSKDREILEKLHDELTADNERKEKSVVKNTLQSNAYKSSNDKIRQETKKLTDMCPKLDEEVGPGVTEIVRNSLEVSRLSEVLVKIQEKQKELNEINKLAFELGGKQSLVN